MWNSVKCDLCGSDKYAVMYKTYSGDYVFEVEKYKITDHKSSVPIRLVRCLKCGLIYANPRPPVDVLSSDYEVMSDDAYIQEEAGRRHSARSILLVLKKFKKRGGRLLDIGCSAGFLLDEAKKDDWEVFGVELSKWAVDFSKNKLGLNNIFQGSLKKANFAANYFDAVVLQDTIEHLPDPKETLIEIRRIMKPSGILCINTPNIDSIASRILKAKWWGVKQHHLIYFTPKTLFKMLEVTGFKSMKLRSRARTFRVKYWLERLRGYTGALNRFFSFVDKNKKMGARLVTINLGDQMEVFARKSRKLEFLDELETPQETLEREKGKVIAVLPAYNAAETLALTIKDIPKDWVDEIILVDDVSCDKTVQIAQKMGLRVFEHKKNTGYGGNQKTCYTKALESGADIIVMVHPDYQYDPKVIPELIAPLQKGVADAVFGSRMMKRGALEGGMPLWKHNANILLTAFENVVLGTYLTEYHSGFRAYSAKYLRNVKFTRNSDGFIFDTEIIVQGLLKNMRIEEVPIRTRYFDEASTIKFWPSVKYGLGILWTLLKYVLHQQGIIRFKQFE